MSSAKFKALIKFYRRNTDLMRGIGHRIRQERLAMGWTQREVAEQLGMKQPNIAAMEKGRVSPTIAVLDAVCGWRGQGLPWLLFGEEEAEPRVAEEGEAYGRAEPTAVSFPVIAEVASDADLGAVWRAVQPPDSCPLPSGVSLVRVVG
ncbi:MAG: helix-turn-helix domain-containing protein, partial [Planctomycetota bacterium]